MSLEGFPIVSTLNQMRKNLITESHIDSEHHKKSTIARVGNWFAHKAMSVVSIPTNTLSACAATAGAVAGGIILGSAKVFTFAVTCGAIKPTFSTGVLYFGERGLHSVGNVFTNIGELIYDAARLVGDTAEVCLTIASKLHFGNFLRDALNAVGEAISTAFDYTVFPLLKRIDSALEKATNEEPASQYETANILKPLDDAAKAERIDFSSSERSFKKIFSHAVFSLANIPANAVAAICSSVAFAVLTSAFVAKVALYTATNLTVPVPTHAGNAGKTMLVSAANVLSDAATDVADIFVVAFKTSDALGLNRLATTALHVISYIPVAVFS